jgi:hypothetical protein
MDDKWIQKKIRESNSKIKRSGHHESGTVELNLRGDEFAGLTIGQIERQLRDFNQTTSRSLERVVIYRNSELFAEWIRHPDGAVTRTFP